MDIAGSTLQNYSIVKQVGEGGMANVYLAKHIQLGHQVALKLLKPEFAEHPNIRKRFLAEAKNLANMEHPNVIKVVDLIDAGDIVAFVMEYIDGQTLEEYINRNKPLSNHTIEPLFSQMVEGLNYIHEKGFIHRDIKPSNFMVTSNGQIKLLDFGIAKNTNEGATDYTKTGLAQQMGTPLYMSPEQVRNTSEVTPLTDIYSLGVVLWQMVKAQKPYDSRHLTLPEIQVAIMKEPLPLTGTKWDKLIQSATQKKEEHRYLEGFSSLSKPKGSISQQNANKIPKYDNKAIIGISIIFLIIIILSIGYHFWKENAINNSPKNKAQSTEIVDPGSDPKASSGENVLKQTKIETTQTEDAKEEKEEPNQPEIIAKKEKPKPNNIEKKEKKIELEIGQYYQGGIIFYLNDDKTHGMICSQYDLGKFSWPEAKKLCSEASFGGYKDWRLPNESELLVLYLGSIFIDGFKSFPYWSSSKLYGENPIHRHFQDGSKSTFFEAETELAVRAIRNF